MTSKTATAKRVPAKAAATKASSAKVATTKKLPAKVSAAKPSPVKASPAKASPVKKGAGSEAATPYALLIRGINVGTKNSLPMADLRAILAELGASDVETYVQSGNAVFASTTQLGELTLRIEERLSKYMGRPIGVTLRTGAELTQIAQASPFSSIATNPSYHCVTFLSHKPTASQLSPLRERDFSPDCFEVIDREIYSWHPQGQGRSALALALTKLKVTGTSTTRNFRTVTKLCEMLNKG